jgi:phage minor structural protein
VNNLSGISDLKEPKLYISKPNRDIIGSIPHPKDFNYKVKLGQLNELDFNLPYETEKNNKLIRNPNIDKLKERFQLKLEIGNKSEWFIINELNDDMDDNGDIRSVHAFSLGYELKDKIIRGYKVTSKNASTVMTDALISSVWTVGYVDSEYDIKYRSFDVSEKTVLDFLYEVAETFGGVLEFDTENRIINLKRQDLIGQYLGFTLSYGKYIKSLGKQSLPDEMTTRLKVYGSEGISIQRVNPTGATYIESFDYFLYPYQEDENGNVIQSSYYMSDGLCKAILAYQDLLETKKGDFTTLLASKETLQEELDVLENELENLKTSMAIILDSLDVAKANGDDTSSLESSKTNKQAEIGSKQSEIDSKNIEIDDVDTEISALQSDVSVESNFTPEQIQERDYYIIERTWEDSNYTDEQDLYDEAVKRLEDLKTPKTVFDIDIVSFFHLVEEKKNWNKINIGDTIHIYYEKFDTNITAKIIEIEHDYENRDIQLTIANTKDIESEEDKLIKMLYESHSTSTTVDMTNYKIDQTSNKLGEINEIINNTWDANTRAIKSGVSQSVTIDSRGLTIKDANDPLKFLRGTAGVIGITSDGGNTFKNALTWRGLVGERIFGKIIAGVNLSIENDAGKFTFDSNGVVIDGASFTIKGGLPKEQLDPNFADGLFELDKTYSNGIKMDTTNGLVVTRSDELVKTTLNATDGIKIQKKESGLWKDKFYVDTEGDLIAEDLIARKLKIRDSGGVTIIDADTGTIDFSMFSNKIGVIPYDNLELRGLTINNGVKDTLVIDSSGNVALDGNITMNGGSITWDKVTPPTASQVGAREDTWTPSYSEVTGSKPPVNADQTFYELRNNSSIRGFYYNSSTGNLELNADYIKAGTLDVNRINMLDIAVVANELNVGGNWDDTTFKEINFRGKYGGAKLTSPNMDIMNMYARERLGILGKNVIEIDRINSDEPPDIGYPNIIDFKVKANTMFYEEVDFTYADVIGLNVTAKFG